MALRASQIVPLAVLGVAFLAVAGTAGAAESDTGGEPDDLDPNPEDEGSYDPPEGLAGLYAELPVDPHDLPQTSAQLERFRRLAERAEQTSGIPDLADFLTAAAYTESRYFTTALNTNDGPAALRLLCKWERNRKRFAGNPWAPNTVNRATCEADPRGSRWRYSGGWLGIMPVVALATNKAANMMDPARVFDPAFAIAFATNHVRNLRRNYNARDWQSIRAAWATTAWAKPGIQSEKEAASAARFDTAIKQSGVRSDLASRSVNVPGNYPGFLQVLADVLAADGRPLNVENS